VLIDGGEGQLAAAMEIMAELGVDDIPVAGVAKGPDRDAGLERFFVPGKPPFMLPLKSPALYYIQRLRDEAHRFAITHQRARRKNDIRTVLADVPGLGPARIRTLLRELGSVSALRAATPERIAEVPGIGPTLAAAIRDKLGSAAGNELDDDDAADDGGDDGVTAGEDDRSATAPADASVG
jgi:excinuclease ABC subunit C